MCSPGNRFDGGSSALLVVVPGYKRQRPFVEQHVPRCVAGHVMRDDVTTRAQLGVPAPEQMQPITDKICNPCTSGNTNCTYFLVECLPCTIPFRLSGVPCLERAVQSQDMIGAPCLVSCTGYLLRGLLQKKRLLFCRCAGVTCCSARYASRCL